MRSKYQRITSFVLMITLLATMLVGCGGVRVKSDESSHSTNNYIPPANEDGYVVITIPTSLMGGQSASEHIAGYHNDAIYKSSGAIPMTERITDVTENEDGTINYVFTTEQFWDYKQDLYEMGLMKLGYGGDFPASIVKADYADIDENGIPWTVVVTVNQDAFNEDYINSIFFSVVWPANYLGQYQLFCGVADDEWDSHIILMDSQNKDTILEVDYNAENLE